MIIIIIINASTRKVIDGTDMRDRMLARPDSNITPNKESTRMNI